ncbi:MAG: polymer-forming cytoskeletal protein [Chloroflexi bacterium]|nr:polymer-forming cytoskeletal protein [Chloroflexota bacterium]
MFKKTPVSSQSVATPIERVTSVLGPGIIWTGNLGGKGGIRIEGTFEGEIAIQGLVVIGETGRITCKNLKANNVIVAGAVKGNIFSEKLEIRSTGRVWGNVVTTAFSTEEGAFLRGQVRMEEKIELNLEENTLLVENPEENPLRDPSSDDGHSVSPEENQDLLDSKKIHKKVRQE